MTDEEATEQVREDADEAADISETAEGEADAVEEESPEVEEEEADTEAEQEAQEDALSPTSTSLVAKVAIEDESLAEDLEAHLAELESEKADLEAEREEAEERAEDFESRLKRKQADFQNYKKRAKKRQEQMKEHATEDLVENLLDVRDNLVRAVEDDHENVESLREGVEMTLKELDRVFDDENVEAIDPEPGAETDPTRHEVMMQVESNQPKGTVADVYQPGYEMGEKVLRAAQVTVSDGDEE